MTQGCSSAGVCPYCVTALLRHCTTASSRDVCSLPPCLCLLLIPHCLTPSLAHLHISLSTPPLTHSLTPSLPHSLTCSQGLFSYRAADGSKFTATLFFLLVQCLTNTALAGAAVLALGTSTSGISTSTSGTSTSTSGTSTSSDKDKCKSEDKEQAVAPSASASASVSASPPALDYVTAGVSYICAMLCSTEALKFVSLPMQALGKSCKMVPVMLFGFLIRGKRYSFRETLAVLLITAGITVFQQKKGSSSGSGSAVGGDHANYGLALLFLSLVLDGVTGACQDRMRERYHPSTHQVRGVFVACSCRLEIP